MAYNDIRTLSSFQKVFTHANDVFDGELIEKLSCYLQSNIPVALTGPYGVGKSYLLANLAVPLLETMFKTKAFVLITFYLFMLKSSKDSFCRVVILNDNSVFDLTPNLKHVNTIISEGKIPVILFEEYNRLDIEGQNLLLPILEIKKGGYHEIFLEQTGDTIILPPETKILLTGNLFGSPGTFKNDAVESRINRISLSKLDARKLRNTILSQNKHEQKSVKLSDLQFYSRKLTLEQEIQIEEELWWFDENVERNMDMDLREIEKLKNNLLHAKDCFSPLNNQTRL